MPALFKTPIQLTIMFALRVQVIQAESLKPSPRLFLELLLVSVIVWPNSDKIAAIHMDIQDERFSC